ncbi:hypothetical protein NliqN6_4804 [Naganishia liquefaciens]|uniref:Pericentrin/AKAP-450 centrosomal targeting domain-containing protein n=1 Tax=Naganishia liquefaciens TaxID=104408 RepID=A0A8H3TWF6_9TREE|nr:hypothetical protein NliqN6_4804 [Naganishia liquefaciens]
MTVDFEDQSVLLRKIEQHAMREQNLSSLPSLDQTSDNEGSEDEEEKAQIEALRRRNREAREREEQDKENRGDLENDDIETPVPARVIKQPIFSRAQKSRRSSTPPFQPSNRILDAVRSPSVSTGSSDQLPSLPNDSGSSTSTIEPGNRSPPEPSHKRFAKTLHDRDDIKGGRMSVGSSANGSFSIATIRHGDAELVDADEPHADSQIDNSLDLPKLSGRDLPQGVEYHDYAVPINGGEDLRSSDERTARRIRNPVRQHSGLRNQYTEITRVPDDRYDTSLEDQINSEYSHGSEGGRNTSDFTDAGEANQSAEGVADIVIQLPDETVDSNGSLAPNWVDTRARYRSQSPHLQRSALPRSPHPRVLRASVHGYSDQEFDNSVENDGSGPSENAGDTKLDEFRRMEQTLATPARIGEDLSALVDEKGENWGRHTESATPAKVAYSPNHSTLSTPGVGRNALLAETPLQATQPPSFDTMIRDRSLRDITHSIQHKPYDSPAPSEYFLGSSRVGSLQTPRPEAKTPANFLISRLESTSKPLRYKAIRGRMSAAGIGDLTRNRTDTSLFSQSLNQIPGVQRDEEFEVGEISGVSLSSSLDLTTDKRMSTARRGRGNMSVPEIHFSDGANEDGVDPSNLVKEMRLINIGLQREYEIVAQEKKDLMQWCESHGYRLSGHLDKDKRTTVDNDNSPPSPPATNELITQRLRRAEEDCQQKELEISQLRGKVEAQADLETQIQKLETDVQAKMNAGERYEIQISELRSQLQGQDEAAHQEKAEWEADFRELEETIRVLREEKERLSSDLAAANIQEYHSQLQEELDDLRNDLQRSKEQLEEYEYTNRDLQAKLQAAVDENARYVGDAFQAEDAAKEAVVVRESLQNDVDCYRTENETLHERIRALEAENANLRSTLEKSERHYGEEVDQRQRLSQQVDRLSTDTDMLLSEKQALQREIDHLRQSAEELAADLQHSEAKYLQEARRASELQEQLELLKKALEAAQGEVSALKHEAANLGESDATHKPMGDLGRAESTIAHLRKRLEACEEQLEIAQHKSCAQARQMATIRQKDVRIETLTSEKASLVQQVRMLTEQQSNLSMAKGPKTPAQSGKHLASGTPCSALRPINRVLLNMRTPRTPGQLSDMTWLSTSSVGSGGEEAMMAQLQAMEEELRRANEHIDKNFDELERRGVLGCSLADELAAALSQIAGLRGELQGLQTRQQRAMDQLVETRCPECDFVFDATRPFRETMIGSSPKTLESATSSPHSDRSRLRQSLASLREQYEQLQHEHKNHRARHDAETEMLRKELDLLGDERATATEVHRKKLLQVEQEHEEHIRQLRIEKEQLEEDKHQMQLRLVEAQKDLEFNAVKSKTLQRELDAANLRVHGLKSEGGELRGENQSLTAKLSELKQHMGSAEKATKESQRLRMEMQRLENRYEASRDATARSEQSRNQLQEQLIALQGRLDSAERRLAEEARSHNTLLKQLTNLEAGIQHHRKEAEQFYRALKTVKNQQGQTKEEDAEAKSLVQDRGQAIQTFAKLQKQLSDAEVRLAQEATSRHNLKQSTSHDEQIEVQARLVADRKVLTGQIRYLHALYARENTFRDGLLLQKQYLLRLLGKFRQTEKETLALIASMGYPPLATKTNNRLTFKSIALAVRFTVKLRASHDQWQQVLQKRPERLQSTS